MRKNSRTQAGAVFVATLFAACLGHSFGQMAAAEPKVPAVESQSSGTDVLPDAPSATLVAGLDFFTSRGETGDSISAKFSHRYPPARLRADERLHRFVERSFSPSALRGDLLDAMQAQYFKAWPGYGTGFPGFERRFGAVFAGHVANSFFGTLFFPTLLHQDPRSPRLGMGASVWRRLGYAVSRVAVTRDDRGQETFNSSLLLSTIASHAVENLYYPRAQRGISSTVAGIGESLADNVQGNLSREFLPDVEQFLWKHAPARVKRFAQCLPFAKQ